MLVLSEGVTNKEIGRRLSVAEGTVKVHLHRIYRKLGIANRTALAILAHTKSLMRLNRHRGCRRHPRTNAVFSMAPVGHIGVLAFQIRLAGLISQERSIAPFRQVKLTSGLAR